MLGVAQFAFGAAAAPLVGIAGSQTALPMVLIIVATSIGAALLYLALSARARPATAP